MRAPLPALDIRRYRERALQTRMMIAHEHALEHHVKRVIIETGTQIARMHRDHGESGLKSAFEVMPHRLRQVMRPALVTTAREFGHRVVTGYKSDIALEGKAFEDIDYAILQAIEEHVGLRISQISEATRALVMEVIRRGIENGWTEYEIATAIEEATAGELAEWRARRIARTETHTAASIGQHEAANASPIEFEKEWLSTEDDRTRHGHAIANGQRVAMDKPFKIGVYRELKEGPVLQRTEEMMYPGDPNASAENVINCRCTVLYVPVEE